MKTRTATALSLVGVLAAGTAAALANTHVLSSRAASNAAPDILTVNAVDQSNTATLVVEPLAVSGTPAVLSDVSAMSSLPAPTSQQPSTKSYRSASTTPATMSPSLAPAAPVSESWSAVKYAVGEAGLVELRFQSSVIEVANVVPRSGWTAIVSGSSTGTSVSVILSSSTAEITFAASLLEGRVVTDVSTRSLVSSDGASSGSSGSSGGGRSGGGDHADDDGHDDDGHDDGHEDHDDDHEEHDDDDD